jgi:DUF4097 and DUF4098 domain-containing protein YvlB
MTAHLLFSRLCVSGLALAFALPAGAQRTRDRDRDRDRSPEASGQDWLERCQDNDRNWNSEHFCELREVRTALTKSLDVDGRQNGGVSVHGWDRAEIRVLAKIQTSAEEMADAKTLASRLTIDATDGRLRADGPSMGRRTSWSVSYEIWVPKQTNLTIATHNGGISVDGLDGRLDLGAMNGGITLRSVAGDVRGETTNGPLNVDLDGEQWRGAGLELRTTNGPVNLSIPQGYSARLETGTTNGGMRIDFPITIQGSIGRRISTQLGSGGPTVRAITTNGPVTISRR